MLRKFLNKLKNMNSETLINVTKEDLEKGNWNDDNNYPVCLAIRRYMRKDCRVAMDYHTVVYWDDISGKWDLIQTPQYLVDKMRLEGKLKPFTFHIHIPAIFLEPLETRNVS